MTTTNTDAAIESFLSFSMVLGHFEFPLMCRAALDGEQWARDRVESTISAARSWDRNDAAAESQFRIAIKRAAGNKRAYKSLAHCFKVTGDNIAMLAAISVTNTARPDGKSW